MELNPIAIRINGNEFVSKKKSGLLILGPPCSGKSSLRRNFADPVIKHYVASKELTAYGKMQDPRVLIDIREGNLVESHIINRIGKWVVSDFLAHRRFGVFDGFGRREGELESLIDNIRVYGDPSNLDFRIVMLDASEEVLLARCEAREKKEEELRSDHDRIVYRISLFIEEREKLIRVLERKKIKHAIINVEKISEKGVCDAVLNFFGVPTRNISGSVC